MLFNSIEYLLLLIPSLALYWLSPSLRVRQYILFFASIYFYMSWSKVFVLLLLGLVLISWLIGNQLHKSANRVWLYIAVILNLSVLCFFKYINFILESALSFYGLISDGGIPIGPYLSVILPLGISFYIFEIISYLVDIHRKKITPEDDVIAFSLFVLFFPHLIAGPICRTNQFIPQVKVFQSFDSEKIYRGCIIFLAGFALKVSIADGISPFVNIIFSASNQYSGFDNLMGVVGFGVQILCDFWGYSLMALGAALLFGFTLPSNFNAPYIALSIQDFWRRWHITLSNWLRDYLYISLGGSKVDSNLALYRNLMITMLLGGLWHGASWNFVIWGGIHGSALIINRVWQTSNIPNGIRLVFSNKVSAWFLTMSTVFIAWIFFRASSFGVAINIIDSIFSFAKNWGETRLTIQFFELILLFPCVHYLVHKVTSVDNLNKLSFMKLFTTITALVVISLTYYINGTEFIYFQF